MNSTSISFETPYTAAIRSLQSLGDVRVLNWPLMHPIQPILVTLGYLLTVLFLTQYMQKREKPFNVKLLSLIHNINLALLSLYMFIEIIRQCFFLNSYKLFGNSIDTSQKGDGLARVLWVFYVSKTLEFIDTLIMCLKKNFHQITFLHVYHHSSIYFIWWIIVLFAPGGESYFSAMLNSFIHVLMYSYYLFASLAPRLPDGKNPSPFHPLFYKKYITKMQLIQFVCMLTQASYDLFIAKELGNYPRFAVWILFVYMFTMLGLFGNFYFKSYKSGRRTRNEKKVQ